MNQATIVSVLFVASGEQEHWWLPQGLARPASLLARLRAGSGGGQAGLAQGLTEQLRSLPGARRVATPDWSTVRDRYLVGLHGPPAPRVVICGWRCPRPGAGWTRRFMQQASIPRPRIPRRDRERPPLPHGAVAQGPNERPAGPA